LTGCKLAQAARASSFSFGLALAHAAGVKSPIWVILAAGKRANKSFILLKRSCRHDFITQRRKLDVPAQPNTTDPPIIYDPILVVGQ